MSHGPKPCEPWQRIYPEPVGLASDGTQRFSYQVPLVDPIIGVEAAPAGDIVANGDFVRANERTASGEGIPWNFLETEWRQVTDPQGGYIENIDPVGGGLLTQTLDDPLAGYPRVLPVEGEQLICQFTVSNRTVGALAMACSDSTGLSGINANRTYLYYPVYEAALGFMSFAGDGDFDGRIAHIQVHRLLDDMVLPTRPGHYSHVEIMTEVSKVSAGDDDPNVNVKVWPVVAGNRGSLSAANWDLVGTGTRRDVRLLDFRDIGDTLQLSAEVKADPTHGNEIMAWVRRWRTSPRP